MLERIVVVAGLAVCIALGVVLMRLYAHRRTQAVLDQQGHTMLAQLGAQADGRPTIVTFSTPSCAACHTAQAPAVAHAAAHNNVRVIDIDAAQQPDVARAFGIMTVPSTAVLDASGKVTALNHGFTPSQQLVRQLQPA
ncbi:MAG TPA: thioredoxin family protein [Chloroflexota bacterium]|jgi:thioredoxin-like negative regulator of GroEL